MSEETRDRYMEFLKEKGCVSQGWEDVFIKDKDGNITIQKIWATKVKSKSDNYIEFCRLNNLDIHENAIFCYEVGKIED